MWTVHDDGKLLRMYFNPRWTVTPAGTPWGVAQSVRAACRSTCVVIHNNILSRMAPVARWVLFLHLFL
nr:MAG TPA: hypothetical protein [Caudoviricetes sp.]